MNIPELVEAIPRTKRKLPTPTPPTTTKTPRATMRTTRWKPMTPSCRGGAAQNAPFDDVSCDRTRRRASSSETYLLFDTFKMIEILRHKKLLTIGDEIKRSF